MKKQLPGNFKKSSLRSNNKSKNNNKVVKNKYKTIEIFSFLEVLACNGKGIIEKECSNPDLNPGLIALKIGYSQEIQKISLLGNNYINLEVGYGYSQKI